MKRADFPIRMAHALRCAMALGLLAFATAGSAEVVNMPGFWVAAGEHSLLLPSGSLKSASLGAEGSLGFDYTLRADRFLFRTGAGVGVRHSTFRLPDTSCELPGSVDRDGYEFTFVYDMASRRDASTDIDIEVPLMLGGQFGRFRFLLGGKFIYNAVRRAKVGMEISTWGDYPQFLDPFTGMPEHQYFDAQSVSYRSSLPANIDAAVSGELGYQLTEGVRSPLITLSLYADFGLLDYWRDRENGLLSMPETFVDEYPEHSTAMIDGVTACHLLSTTSVASGAVRNLSVGLKLTVAFPTVSQHKHHSSAPCRCEGF